MVTFKKALKVKEKFATPNGGLKASKDLKLCWVITLKLFNYFYLSLLAFFIKLSKILTIYTLSMTL